MATTSLPGAVYLDACVLIDYVKGEYRAETIRSTLAHIDKGSITLVSSTLMLTEVLPAHANDGDKHRAVRDAIRSLLVSPRTRLVDVDQAVAQRAADLRLAHRLKTPDAIHLATALIAGAQVMFTNDGGIPKGQMDGLKVCEPFDVDHPPGTLYAQPIA